MDYLKNHLDVNGTIDTLKNGLVYIRSVLHLDIASVVKQATKPASADEKRDCMLDPDSFKKSQEIKDAVYATLGENYKDRRQTKVISQGTVYGRESKVRLDFSMHSHYGMNPHYLNDVGVPNPAAISKRLREIVTSTELKEQRLNNFINATVVSDFYDNATSLLYVLLQKIQISKIFEKMKVYNHTYTLVADEVGAICVDNEDTSFLNLVNYIRMNMFRMGVSDNDKHIYTILESMKRWLRALPAAQIPGNPGQMVPNPAYHEQRFQFEVQYWQMYDYDDGHSQSGVTFGNVVGMLHNRFKVPSEWHHSASYDLGKLAVHDMDMPVSEEAINNFGKARYYVNCSGMTMKEVAILGIAMDGNKRSTPFLVDQDVDFRHNEEDKIYALRPRSQDLAVPEFVFTTKDLKSTLTKLVVTHKWYEELKAAAVAMKYWLVQPATETVESHWWLQVERTLSLPKLGLRRAVLPMLLEGDGAQLSREAIVMAKDLVSDNDSLFYESMLANTTWYWGEYLNQFNSTTVTGFLHKYDNDYFDTLRPCERADALSSAVLGIGVPRPTFSMMGTYFSQGLKAHYHDVVKFGNIDIAHLAEYGYTVNHTNLYTNTLVPPSCVGLITGLGGSLLNGTPHHSIFKIRPTVERKIRGKIETAYNYYDLWAYGVVQRWQGYDVHYKHPLQGGKHRMYAPNDVSIAMPPVTPATLQEVLPYIVLQDTERSHCFGSSIEWLRNFETFFSWRRTQVSPLREPEYNSLPASSNPTSYLSADRILMTTKMPKAYNCLLYSTYNADDSDFQVAYPEIAIPLEVNVGQLQLPETDTGPRPEDIPPDEIDP